MFYGFLSNSVYLSYILPLVLRMKCNIFTNGPLMSLKIWTNYFLGPDDLQTWCILSWQTNPTCAHSIPKQDRHTYLVIVHFYLAEIRQNYLISVFYKHFLWKSQLDKRTVKWAIHKCHGRFSFMFEVLVVSH